jgi:hypothetical protein
VRTLGVRTAANTVLLDFAVLWRNRHRQTGGGNGRVSNGDQVSRVAALAMKRCESMDFPGYWQRHIAD